MLHSLLHQKGKGHLRRNYQTKKKKKEKEKKKKKKKKKKKTLNLTDPGSYCKHPTYPYCQCDPGAKKGLLPL
jgi:hypothetical protein